MPSLLKEAIHYVAMGYFGVEDKILQIRKSWEKARLYYRWGKESGERTDFYQVLEELEHISVEEMQKGGFTVQLFGLGLDSVLELLRIELGAIASWFDFFTANRLRMELREIVFSVELEKKMGEFIDREENIAKRAETMISRFNDVELTDKAREERRILLEEYEAERLKINQGIEAFYGRLKEYIQNH